MSSIESCPLFDQLTSINALFLSAGSESAFLLCEINYLVAHELQNILLISLNMKESCVARKCEHQILEHSSII